MTSLQKQARALGDPTRHAIHRFIASSDHPVGITELATHVEVHHNAVRQHLDKLVDAGLVIESTASTGRPGRPRLEYIASPSADSRWGTVGPYQRLSLLLAEIVSSGDTPVEVGRRAGHRLRVPATDDTLADVALALDRQGFEPRIIRHDDGDGEVVLAVCPFAAAADQDSDVVCGLHRGIADGLVEGTELEVTDLVVEDPQRAGCRVRLRRRSG